MKKEISRKFLKVQEIAMEDEDYRLLMDEHGARNDLFQAVMESLSKDQ